MKLTKSTIIKTCEVVLLILLTNETYALDKQELTDDEKQGVIKVCSSDADIINALERVVSNVKGYCHKLNSAIDKEKFVKDNPPEWSIKD
jgi:hypothetical protein